MIGVLIGAMLSTYINVPVATMFEEATDHARVASQAIYSEPVEILQEFDSRVKIQTPDGYQGWVSNDTLIKKEKEYPENPSVTIVRVNRWAAHLYSVQDTEYGPILTLPFESRLEVVDELGDTNGRWLQVRLLDGTLAYIQRGDVLLNPKPLSMNDALNFCENFLIFLTPGEDAQALATTALASHKWFIASSDFPSPEILRTSLLGVDLRMSLLRKYKQEI